MLFFCMERIRWTLGTVSSPARYGRGFPLGGSNDRPSSGRAAAMDREAKWRSRELRIMNFRERLFGFNNAGHMSYGLWPFVSGRSVRPH